MKKDIHPKYHEVSVTCTCGFQFVTRSTVGKDKLSLEVCSNCHPFYTGTQKMVDTAGRVDRFRQKYAKAKAPAQAPTEVKAAKAPAKAPTEVKAAAKPVKTTKPKKKEEK